MLISTLLDAVVMHGLSVVAFFPVLLVRSETLGKDAVAKNSGRKDAR